MGRTSDAKERMMDAALALIWEHSYGSVTIDAICARADVRKGSFYYFFASKSALAVAALDRRWQETRQVWDRCFSPSTPPLERFDCYFRWVYECQAERKAESGRVLGCQLFSLGCEISTQDEAIRDKVRQILDGHVKYFESAIRDADGERLIEPGDVTACGRAVFALYEGMLTQARIHNDAELLKDLPEAIRRLLRVRAAVVPG